MECPPILPFKQWMVKWRVMPWIGQSPSLLRLMSAREWRSSAWRCWPLAELFEQAHRSTGITQILRNLPWMMVKKTMRKCPRGFQCAHTTINHQMDRGLAVWCHHPIHCLVTRYYHKNSQWWQFPSVLFFISPPTAAGAAATEPDPPPHPNPIPITLIRIGPGITSPGEIGIMPLNRVIDIVWGGFGTKTGFFPGNRFCYIFGGLRM